MQIIIFKSNQKIFKKFNKTIYQRCVVIMYHFEINEVQTIDKNVATKLECTVYKIVLH